MSSSPDASPYASPPGAPAQRPPIPPRPRTLSTVAADGSPALTHASPPPAPASAGIEQAAYGTAMASPPPLPRDNAQYASLSSALNMDEYSAHASTPSHSQSRSHATAGRSDMARPALASASPVATPAASPTAAAARAAQRAAATLPELDPASYTLLSLLGQGGFAAVYRARYDGQPPPSQAATPVHAALSAQREVAVKVFDLEANWLQYMERDSANDSALSPRRLRGGGGGMRARNLRYKLEEVWREVSVTALLRHPNICKFTHCFVAATAASEEQEQQEQPHRSYAATPPVSVRVRPGADGAQSSPSLPLQSPSPGASPSPLPPASAAAVAPATPSVQPAPTASVAAALAAAAPPAPPATAQFFVIMPLAEGSLRQIVSALFPHGIKDEALLASILAPLLSTLAYLHSSSIHLVHRDLKLDNVLIDRRAQILLADWGIAESFWEPAHAAAVPMLASGGAASSPVAAAAAAAAQESDDDAELDGEEDDGEEDDAAQEVSHSSQRSPGHGPHASVSSLGASGAAAGKPARAAKAPFAGTPLIMAPELLAHTQGSAPEVPLHSRHASAAAGPVSPRGAAGSPQSASDLYNRNRSASMASPSELNASSAAGPRRGSLLAGPRSSISGAAGSGSGIGEGDYSDPNWAASFLARPPLPRRGCSFKRAAAQAAKSDIWSLGISALELAFGSPPHSSARPSGVGAAAAAALGAGADGGANAAFLRRLILDSPAPTVASTAREHAPPGTPAASSPMHGFSKSFHEFIAAALEKDPLKRASAAQLLQHAFIKKNVSSKTIAIAGEAAQQAAAAGAVTGSNASPASPTGVSAASSPSSPTSTASISASSIAASSCLVPKLLYQSLLEPWQRLLHDRRVREVAAQKEAERLAKKASLSRTQQRAVQQAHDALRQGQAAGGPAAHA